MEPTSVAIVIHLSGVSSTLSLSVSSLFRFSTSRISQGWVSSERLVTVVVLFWLSTIGLV